MNNRAPNRNYAFVGAFIEELNRAGVRHACICPGSRSTPLTMTVAQHPALKSWVHLDERSAAFFALGLARFLQEPVLLICTSGTAAANFLPAVAEANLSEVPLIVATADRPPELREVGAPQTMDQIRLFGSHAKWSVDVATPEATVDLMRYARTLAARAVALAQRPPAGVVHLNFPFREPLVPVAMPQELPQESVRQRTGWLPRSGNRPYATVADGVAMLPQPQNEALAADLAGQRRGLIVVGPQPDPRLAPAVARLARAIGYPILAEPPSGVRCGQHDLGLVIAPYDAMLRDDRFAERAEPSLIVRFGATPVSKPLLDYLARHANCRQLLVTGSGRWPDPTLSADQVIHAEPVALCQSLVDALATSPPAREANEWLDLWLGTSRTAANALAAWLEGLPDMFEGRVFSETAALAPPDTIIFAGNSMPVRDLDSFTPKAAKPLRFLANRGLSGIDGVVSSALGSAAASESRVVLLIGDISFYHDMNGLFAAKRHRLDATVVLINNDGGGIFSFLPQAAYPDTFEEFWGTPHGLDFRPAVEMYGGRFRRVESWQEFRHALTASFASQGLDVIEVRTDRQRNVALHRQAWAAVAAALAETWSGKAR